MSSLQGDIETPLFGHKKPCVCWLHLPGIVKGLELVMFLEKALNTIPQVIG